MKFKTKQNNSALRITLTVDEAEKLLNILSEFNDHLTRKEARYAKVVGVDIPAYDAFFAGLEEALRELWLAADDPE